MLRAKNKYSFGYKVTMNNFTCTFMYEFLNDLLVLQISIVSSQRFKIAVQTTLK